MLKLGRELTEMPANLISSIPTARAWAQEKKAAPHPKDMSLLAVCGDCRGRCCVGRTMVSERERLQVVTLKRRDYFVHWSDDLFYLELGRCHFVEHVRC